MTDYNDGKWHGWNGGECPVDPKATVQAAYADEGGPLEMEAGEFIWSGSETAIVAFRVIKPAPPKPREYWLRLDAEGRICGTDDEDEPPPNWDPARTILVREVLP